MLINRSLRKAGSDFTVMDELLDEMETYLGPYGTLANTEWSLDLTKGAVGDIPTALTNLTGTVTISKSGAQIGQFNIARVSTPAGFPGTTFFSNFVDSSAVSMKQCGYDTTDNMEGSADWVYYDFDNDNYYYYEDNDFDSIVVSITGGTDATNQDLIDWLKNNATKRYSVTNTLTNCTSSNNATAVLDGSAYSATITAGSGYTLAGATVSVTMGGTDITSTAYNNGLITIASVTGNVVISISAVSSGGNPAPIYLTGNFNNWNTSDNNYQFSYISGSSGDAKLTTSLSNGNEFLVYANGNWYNFAIFVGAASSDFTGGSGQNIVCVVAGTYDIYFNANTIYIEEHN